MVLLVTIELPSFRYLSLVNGEGRLRPLNNQINYGQALGSTANPEIRWEKTKTF